MMFRFGKIIESGNKPSRSDRFAEMSKQQQLIENKKQEIKAKFEEMKRKGTDDASKKSDSSNSTKSKDTKTLMSSRMQSWKNDDRWRKKQSNTEVSEPPPGNADLFSNDGSFLEKYKRMTGSSKDALNEERADTKRRRYDEQSEENSSLMARASSEGIPYPPPNIGIHPATSALNVPSPAQSLYSLTAHPPPSVHTSLAAVSASMPVLSAVTSSATSLQTVSLIQVPVSVPATSVIFSCPIETTLVSSEPVVHLPVVHSTLSHSSVSMPLQTMPLQTTVIPAQIQITSSAQLNQQSTNVLLVQPECMTQPTTLPNTNVPPPALPIPPPQPPSMPPPPVFSAAPPSVYSMPPHSVSTSSLPPVHLPPPNFNRCAAHYAEGVAAPPPPALDCKASVMKLEKNDFGGERTSITSEADERHAASRSRQREGGRDTNVGNLDDIETVARVVADCGDDMENMFLSKSANDEKLCFLRDKQSPPYIAFRTMVEKFRQEKMGNGNVTSQGAVDSSRGSAQSERKRSTRPAVDTDDSDAEEPEERRRRRRKRRSRWAPEDTKVDVAAPVRVNPNVGIAAPLSLGGIVPVAPPSQQTKLPGMSGPIISQVTRTDPALLQYAMKAFGTINLSEEDWKKAEDHYKINLLYQDMLKKRKQLEKLEAAGKHKYAYDSDEDTVGGTWEHKLRQQEMVATQLWADELTERSKGKHHIGDFLPPDELERFMEKYNALKQGREPDLSDYKEFKLKEDNIGFQMLQKLGWTEGQGLGSDGSGIVNPVNKAPTYTTNYGLGIEKPDDVRGDDDEYDAYRKRMMLAYRFRPNPLNNPRRPYY